MVQPAPPVGLQGRLAALSPRERRFLIAGAAALLIFLVYFLWPSDDEGESVDFGAEAPPAAVPAYVPPPALPAPSMTAPGMAAPGMAATPMSQAQAGAASGVILRGVMGGGPSGGAAIFSFPDGAQRVVRVGRDLMPGMTLRQIGVSHAIASTGGGDIRLELNKAGGTMIAATPSPATVAAPAAPATGHRESLNYRLGLAPQKVDGRVRGYAIRPTAKLPVLERAGLRPGDVLVSVNGQAVESDEKVLELPGEIAGAYTAEFEFIRGGQRMKRTLQINKRPGQ